MQTIGDKPGARATEAERCVAGARFSGCARFEGAGRRRRRWAPPVIALLLAARVAAADSARPIDVFGTAGGWKPAGGSTAPALREGGLAFACPFKAAGERIFWDRAVSLNLEGVSVLELDLTCPRPDAVRTVGLYLKSGDGWYLWLVSPREAGRQRLTLPLGQAATEGSPRGWDAIDGVRLSFTRAADVNTVVTVHGLRARVCEVVLIQGTSSLPEGAERNAGRGVALRVSRWLNEAGVVHAVTTDEDADAGALQAARVAILPYNSNPGRRELKALTALVERGGKLIVYAESEALADLMGVTLGDYQAAKTPGQWSGFIFARSAPAGLPDRVYQASANIRPVSPSGSGGKVIAAWFDEAGQARPESALGSDRAGFLDVARFAGGRRRA